MKIARMLGAFGLLLLFAAISMGAGNSPQVGVTTPIGVANSVGPQSIPGSPLQQRGSALPGDGVWSQDFRENLVYEFLSEVPEVVVIGGIRRVISIKDTSTNGLVASQASINDAPFQGADRYICFTNTAHLDIPLASEVKTTIIRVQFLGDPVLNSSIMQCATQGLITDLGWYPVSWAPTPADQLVYAATGTELLLGTVNNLSTWTAIISDSGTPQSKTVIGSLSASVIGLSGVGGAPNFKLIGLWGWSDIATVDQLKYRMAIASGYKLGDYIPNKPTPPNVLVLDGMTIASEAFRSGLQAELLPSNRQTYVNGGATFVYQIDDSSGNNRHASQTTEVYMPRVATGSALWVAPNTKLYIPTIASRTKTVIFKFKAINHGYAYCIIGGKSANHLGSLGWYPTGNGGVNPVTGTTYTVSTTLSTSDLWTSQIQSSGSLQKTSGLSDYDFSPTGIGHMIYTSSEYEFLGLWLWDRSLSDIELAAYTKTCEESNP